MKPLHITEHEARQELLAYLDIDDLALLLSRLAVYQNRTVVVKGTDKESYACWNGYMSDKRGDLNCFSDKETA